MRSTSLFRPELLAAVACALLLLHCDDGGSGGSESSAASSSSSGTSGTGGESATSGSGGPGGAGQGGSGDGGSAAGGASADSCEGRLICDDFEDDDLGAAPKSPWSTATNNGTVVVDGARARSGSRSVKVRTEAGQYKQAFFFTEGAPAFPAPGNVVYGRMMIYMDQASDDGVHWTMIQGSGPLPGQNGVTALYRYGGQWQQQMMANYETFNLSTDCWQHSQTKMPTGKWACMEWRFDGPNNEMRFWLDGQEIADLHMKDKGEGCGGHDLNDMWLAPTFDKMSLGWESYQSEAAREAWIDDVVIDDEQIGCPAGP
jgi:hypothetical protein